MNSVMERVEWPMVQMVVEEVVDMEPAALRTLNFGNRAANRIP